MWSKVRQGSLGFWEIAIVISIPALVAVLGGVSLAVHSLNQRAKQAEAEQLRELTARARSVTGNFLEEVETLRSHALAIHQVAQQSADSRMAGHLLRQFSEFLYWAELENNDRGVPAIRRSLKRTGGQESSQTGANPGTAVSLAHFLDDEYITEALKHLKPSDLKANGKAMLRLKQDPNRSNEWLALVFPVAGADEKAVMAIVDPVNVFSVFQRMGRGDEGSGSRAYLIGSDGYVLAHSQASYSGASFGRTPVFQNALRGVFSGARSSGSGIFKSIDHAQVLTSFSRAGSLPLCVVVERVREGFAASPWGSWVQAQSALSLPLTGLFGLVMLWVGASSWTLLLRIQKLANPAQVSSEISAEVPREDSPSASPAGPARSPFETALREAQKLPESPPSQSPQKKMPSQNALERMALEGLVDSQLVEQAFSQELHSPADQARSLHERRIALARFESELERLVASGDPLIQRRGLQKLASFAREICGRPVLFFEFQPLTKLAVLAAYAGVNSQTMPKSPKNGLSFPVINTLEMSAARAAKKGEILPLMDYGPLVGVMEKKWGIPRFEAWAVQGFKSGKFLGILVIVADGHDTRLAMNQDYSDESLARLIRSAGHYYENVFIRKNGLQ